MRVFVRLRSTVCRALVFEETGDPLKVLKIRASNLPDALNPNQVRVRMLAAPINPADINTVEGVYGTKPALPAIGGSEGVGVVEEVGAKVTTLAVGNWVIPAVPGSGTWRTALVAKEDELHKIDNDLPLPAAATIAVNPCTAYRLLADYAHTDGVIIQNGASSSVGQAVIQLARHRFFVHTINVLRDKPDYQQTKEKLLALGADVVVKEDEVATPKFWSELASKGIPRPTVAFNAVGGKSATDFLKTLSEGGSMVTYGALSKKPFQVGASALIFSNLTLKGFWLSKWVRENSAEKRQQMLQAIAACIRKKQLTLPSRSFSFEPTEQGQGGWSKAIAEAQALTHEKTILTF